MTETIAALRRVLGRLALTVAYAESKVQEADEAKSDDLGIHSVNLMVYTACHTLLDTIINELEAANGSRGDSSSNIVH